MPTTPPMPRTTRIKLIGTILLVVVAVGVGWTIDGRRRRAVPKVTGNPSTTSPLIASAPLTSLDLGSGQLLQLVLVPPGTFQMGSPDTDPDHDSSEGPVHTVTIKYPLYVGKFEVTQAQWAAVNGSRNYQFKGDNLPCEEISWAEAKWFCDTATKKTGRTVRLPSEAEWEYAARGGTTTPFCFGAAIDPKQANFGQQPGGPAEKSHLNTTPVGTYPPNKFGLYDTVGNVGEWCQDLMHDDYTHAPADGSAWETGGDGKSRVYRGGAYNNDAASCRSAMRLATREPEGDRSSTKGFRVVVEIK